MKYALFTIKIFCWDAVAANMLIYKRCGLYVKPVLIALKFIMQELHIYFAKMLTSQVEMRIIRQNTARWKNSSDYFRYE